MPVCEAQVCTKEIFSIQTEQINSLTQNALSKHRQNKFCLKKSFTSNASALTPSVLMFVVLSIDRFKV